MTGVKRLNFKFRWPILQTGEDSVEMSVPTSHDGQPLVKLNGDSLVIKDLIDREHDALLNELEDRAIRELAIVRD